MGAKQKENNSAYIVLVRLAFGYFTTVLSLVLVQSEWLIQLTGRPLVLPGEVGASPLLIYGIALFLFWLLHRSEFTKNDLVLSTKRIVTAGLCSLFMLLILFMILHPSVAFVQALEGLARQNRIWVTVYGSSLLMLSMLIAPVQLILFFPFSTLKKHSRSLCILFAIVILYPFTFVLDELYFPHAAQIVLRLSALFLSIFSSAVSYQPSSLQLTYENYTVFVGPICMGTNSILLFAALYAFLCQRISVKKTLNKTKAWGAFVAGVIAFFLLNVLRIGLIMLVGASSPETATDIFHGALGAIFFFGVFLVYVKVVLPWLIVKEG